MRRLILIIISFLGILLSISPVAAQGGSIATVIDNRSELSTLKVFLDASPEMRDILNGSTAYTLFAPNNQAFANLASSLEIPLADLLRSPEIVTAILQYHLITGSFNSQQVAARSGQVIPTLLPGAFIQVRLNDNGVTSVNNVVEIVIPDVRASNGRIHIINDVLLNRVIDNLVQDFDIGSLITPNPTSPNNEATEEALVVTATTNGNLVATPVFTATAAPSSRAFLRFAHFAPEAPAVDVYINDTLVQSANFGQISEFQTFAGDIYHVQITESGASDVLLPEFDLTLLSGDFKTIILTGQDNLTSTVIEEDFSQLVNNTARVLFLHTVDNAPSVDILLDGDVLTGGIAFGGRTTIDIPAGDYDPLITESGDGALLLDPDTIRFETENFYLVAVIGTDEALTLAVASLSSSAAQTLRQGGSVSQTVTVTPTPSETEALDIIETLIADDDFSILIAALESADEDVINRLGSRLQEPVTFLAPTDTAFENLFASLGLSQRRVFSDTRILSDILRYHVVEGQFYAADFRAATGTSIPTLLQPNQAFFVTVDRTGNIFINGRIRFERVDIQTSNGVIHVLDDVLLPQSALDAYGF